LILVLIIGAFGLAVAIILGSIIIVSAMIYGQRRSTTRKNKRAIFWYLTNGCLNSDDHEIDRVIEQVSGAFDAADLALQRFNHGE